MSSPHRDADLLARGRERLEQFRRDKQQAQHAENTAADQHQQANGLDHQHAQNQQQQHQQQQQSATMNGHSDYSAYHGSAANGATAVDNVSSSSASFPVAPAVLSESSVLALRHDYESQYAQYGSDPQYAAYFQALAARVQQAQKALVAEQQRAQGPVAAGLAPLDWSSSPTLQSFSPEQRASFMAFAQYYDDPTYAEYYRSLSTQPAYEAYFSTVAVVRNELMQLQQQQQIQQQQQQQQTAFPEQPQQTFAQDEQPQQQPVQQPHAAEPHPSQPAVGAPVSSDPVAAEPAVKTEDVSFSVDPSLAPAADAAESLNVSFPPSPSNADAPSDASHSQQHASTASEPTIKSEVDAPNEQQHQQQQQVPLEFAAPTSHAVDQHGSSQSDEQQQQQQEQRQQQQHPSYESDEQKQSERNTQQSAEPSIAVDPAASASSLSDPSLSNGVPSSYFSAPATAPSAPVRSTSPSAELHSTVSLDYASADDLPLHDGRSTTPLMLSSQQSQQTDAGDEPQHLLHLAHFESESEAEDGSGGGGMPPLDFGASTGSSMNRYTLPQAPPQSVEQQQQQLQQREMDGGEGGIEVPPVVASETTEQFAHSLAQQTHAQQHQFSDAVESLSRASALAELEQLRAALSAKDAELAQLTRALPSAAAHPSHHQGAMMMSSSSASASAGDMLDELDASELLRERMQVQNMSKSLTSLSREVDSLRLENERLASQQMNLRREVGERNARMEQLQQDNVALLLEFEKLEGELTEAQQNAAAARRNAASSATPGHSSGTPLAATVCDHGSVFAELHELELQVHAVWHKSLEHTTRIDEAVEEMQAACEAAMHAATNGLLPQRLLTNGLQSHAGVSATPEASASSAAAAAASELAHMQRARSNSDPNVSLQDGPETDERRALNAAAETDTDGEESSSSSQLSTPPRKSSGSHALMAVPSATALGSVLSSVASLHELLRSKRTVESQLSALLRRVSELCDPTSTLLAGGLNVGTGVQQALRAMQQHSSKSWVRLHPSSTAGSALPGGASKQPGVPVHRHDDHVLHAQLAELRQSRDALSHQLQAQTERAHLLIKDKILLAKKIEGN